MPNLSWIFEKEKRRNKFKLKTFKEVIRACRVVHRANPLMARRTNMLNRLFCSKLLDIFQNLNLLACCPHLLCGTPPVSGIRCHPARQVTYSCHIWCQSPEGKRRGNHTAAFRKSIICTYLPLAMLPKIYYCAHEFDIDYFVGSLLNFSMKIVINYKQNWKQNASK